VSLLDDARALAAVDPIDDVGFSATAYTCFWCSPPDRLESKHAANCPWLSTSAIAAVVEAAERVVSRAYRPDTDRPDRRGYVAELKALAAALKGEVVP
jgi:hypothetical protein